MNLACHRLDVPVFNCPFLLPHRTSSSSHLPPHSQIATKTIDEGVKAAKAAKVCLLSNWLVV